MISSEGQFFDLNRWCKIKWYKHYSDALDDPFIMELMDRFGHLGYVAWFGLIEIIARESGTNLTGYLEISPTYLRRKLRSSQPKLRQVFEYCRTSGRLSVTFSENVWEFYFPKILEIKDNYTKDLQAAGKKLSLDKDTEKEEDTEEDKELKIKEKEKEQKEKESPEKLKTLLKEIHEKLPREYFNPYEFVQTTNNLPIECHIDLMERLLMNDSFMNQEVDNGRAYAQHILNIEAGNVQARLSEQEAEEHKE